MKKDQSLILFCDEILRELEDHELYSFEDGYSTYYQVNIAAKDQFETIFISP